MTDVVSISVKTLSNDCVNITRQTNSDIQT